LAAFDLLSLGGFHSFSRSGRVFFSKLNGLETPTLVLMSAGGYDTPNLSASFSRYDSRRMSGSLPSSYDVCRLFTPFYLLIYLTFIFSRGQLYRVADLLRPDRLVDLLMIVMFQIVLNCPIGILSIFSIGKIIIDLVLQVGLVAHQALIVMNIQHAIQIQTTGSALLRGGARLWRNS
jgi:hypothetical protein